MRPRTLAAALSVLAACGGPPDAPSDGAASEAAQRVARALPAFRAAPAPTRERDPRLAPAREALGARRYADARTAAALFLDDPEAGPEAALLTGIAHLEERQPALALAPLAAVIDGGPTFRLAPEAFFFYGRALVEVGDLEGARAALEANRELSPQPAEALFRLALLDLEAGDLERAAEGLREARAGFTRPRDVAKAGVYLADIALEHGDVDTARAELERSVEVFPHYEAFYRLATLAREAGDDEAAERYMALFEQWRAQLHPEPPGPAPVGER